MTSQVNDKEFSVTLTMYFAVRWEEPRLTTNNTVSEGQWTPIDLQFLNHLWVPNIFIYDLRSFAALNVLKKLAGVWIVEGKEIYYNQVSPTSRLRHCKLFKGMLISCKLAFQLELPLFVTFLP